ncbi:MAG: DUF559 domain-containing protein [Candidatus Omnitrophica bacterium]|nr:DUF559 domain-containing protein [Candidatus Omnitrophota bacterium]
MKNKLGLFARKLRNNPTEVEKKMWIYLQRKQLDGLKFRRQQPIGRYIVDFVNFEKRIIVEVDGGQHALNKRQDEERDACFRNQDFKVLRFWDNEVLENPEGVMGIIRNACVPPSLSPPTRGGESK